MTKLTKNASDRLINLLYTATSRDVATKIPIIKKHLYELINKDKEIRGSILDDLMENQWKQKPMEKATVDIEGVVSTKRKSNILKFKCQNSYISEFDFYNIYPISRERTYLLPRDIYKGITFEVIKSRNPFNLLHNGLYYLIFSSYVHACTYLLETFNKSINGFRLNMEFVEPSSNELKYMTSPYLDHSINDVLHHSVNPFALADPGRVPVLEIFKYSNSKSSIIKKILELEKKRHQKEYHTFAKDPTSSLLADLVDKETRQSSVLVRNLPFGTSRFALPKLLWNYEMAPLEDDFNCYTTILSDPIRQVNLHLIRFANKSNARRFVRNFHGKRWESVQSRKEKPLYEPILCEIVN
ncbi:uncharacterized protein PRCAT00000269001 [Priceomyces carsonii]|uniref:uncharacterized protein n=1 Tax=Priceomyces carsonii TaxID=28549 RepID=UPI002ED812F6|nr:unnamed protein product [Priceomyces carsonii]